MDDIVHLAKCSLCGWLGKSDGLVRAGKKQQSKFDICPGCGKTKVKFWDKALNMNNSYSCLTYFAKRKDVAEKLLSK